MQANTSAPWLSLIEQTPSLNEEPPHFGGLWNEFKIPAPACCPLLHMGLLLVEGPQAELFLQGQLTLDIKQVSETSLQLGGYCNLKGRLHSIFYVTRLNTGSEPAFLCCLPYENLPHFQSTLKKFALFSKVTLTDVTTQWAPIGIWGQLRELPFQTFAISPERSIILLPAADLNTVWPTLITTHSPCSPLVWIADDIKSKQPWITRSAEEKFLPHHLNLPKLGAVDFKKGCYVGQEIVARMEYLGKNKKHLEVDTIKTSQLLSHKSNVQTDEIVIRSPISKDETIILKIVSSNIINK
jgi:tRNA-modifying protein YgfZ